ncbi:hypothetical protein [Humidesulfovibrio sp.]
MLVFVFGLGCWLWPARAQADEPRWGHLYSLTGNVTVRENPSDDSLKVRVFKAGQRVRVDFIDAGWAAVFDPKEPVRSELKALGYARLDELRTHGAPTVAQASSASPASSIEVRKPSPDGRPEVIVNGTSAPAKPAPVKAATKAEAAPAKSTSKSETAPAKLQANSPAKASAKPSAKPDKGFGEIRVPDRDLAVRASRTTESEFKKLIRPGQRVRIDFWEDGWFAVFDPQEKTRDLARAWGYSRDKYLVPESAYAGPPPAAAAAPPVASSVAPSAVAEAAPSKAQKPKPAEDPDVGYSVIDRKAGGRKPPVTTVRVRLDLTKPPATELLRKIVREIWKAERRKDENLQLEVYLNGMDAHGLSYATARFHDDGRLREFWWREVVLGKPGD